MQLCAWQNQQKKKKNILDFLMESKSLYSSNENFVGTFSNKAPMSSIYGRRQKSFTVGVKKALRTVVLRRRLCSATINKTQSHNALTMHWLRFYSAQGYVLSQVVPISTVKPLSEHWESIMSVLLQVAP